MACSLTKRCRIQKYPMVGSRPWSEAKLEAYEGANHIRLIAALAGEPKVLRGKPPAKAAARDQAALETTSIAV